MKRSSGRHRSRGRKRSERAVDSDTDTSDQEYRVGPGRPPKEFQFKPGQSGNPKGARRKPRSIAPDLKALFERALSEKVTLRQGEKETIITKAAAGIEQLVNQFAKGDRHARRDLLALAARLGVNLAAGQGDALEQSVATALSANDEALLADYVRRHAVQPDRPGETDAGSLRQERSLWAREQSYQENRSMKTLNPPTLSCSPQRMLSPSTAHVNAACRKDLVSFVRKCFHVLAPSATFHMNWHICAIALLS